MRHWMLILLFAAGPLSAAEIPVKDGDQLVVRGVAAQVNVTATPGAGPLRLGDLPSGWSWRRDGSNIVIEASDSASRSDLANMIKTPPARATVDVQGPSLPVDVTLRDGGVQLNKGAHEAVVRLQQGRVTAMQRTAGLRVHGRRVDVSVSDSTGRLELDVFQGAVNVKQHQGNADVELFGGQFSSESSKGTLALVTRNAPAKVQKFAGTLQLDLDKGGLTAGGLQGRVEGKTGEANVQLQVLADTDVNLQSQSGRVQIQLPPASGAALNLQSTGDVFVPGELKVARAGNDKSVRGKLKGEKSQNQITVRSADGVIVVK